MNARILVLAVAVSFAPLRGASAQHSAPDLDAIARQAFTQQKVVGGSVLVVQGRKILLHKGYGFADLGLEAPAKPETVYHVVGPMLPFTGIAVLQQVERGKVSLDDDISKFIPEFPLQGHRVTVRQLLNHTSGIVDYHYLGDPIEATSRQPKALDEVMALYAGKNWVNEPGKKWDWSISGFQLLVTIVEQLTVQSFPEYMQQNIFGPSGVTSTTYCDDFTLVKGLSHSYRKFQNSYVPANENGMAYNSDLRFCSTVGDIYELWRAIADKKLVQPQTFTMMTTAEGAAARMNPQDPQAQYGFALILNHEGQHRRIGQHGSLLGYSGSLYDFPDDQLTVVVLTNTEDQNAYAISRALARAALGLPELPATPASAQKALADLVISRDERKQLAGTFVLKLEKLTPGLHDSFAQYRRTYRVFDENGRLMIQPLGEGPGRLLRQTDDSFAMRASPGNRISFVIQNGRAISMKMDSQDFGVPLSGGRIGDADPKTFHQQLQP
jgi:CubicO group peptidase (beta-lactamase class C family)